MVGENFANLYRPKTFAEVVGQDTVVAALKRIASAPGISVRSIFLHGGWGSGKTTSARLFAKALNCRNFAKLGDVCNECPECKEVASKTSQLYWELDATAVGNVDAIRGLTDRLAIAPQGRRLVVLDECHAATKQALNALLKIVEDGVPNTIFLFASTEDILPTIKSRSLCLDINIIPKHLIVQRIKEVATLRGIQISDQNLTVLAMKSQGHMRDAFQLLQLYDIAGEKGLESSYFKFREFVTCAFSKTPKRNPAEILDEILAYPIVDIKMSIGLFIRNLYLSDPNSLEGKLLAAGIGKNLFAYFFTPTAQTALRSEVGTEILLRALLEKLGKPSK